jgi:hypothetical protein
LNATSAKKNKIINLKKLKKQKKKKLKKSLNFFLKNIYFKQGGGRWGWFGHPQITKGGGQNHPQEP